MKISRITTSACILSIDIIDIVSKILTLTHNNQNYRFAYVFSLQFILNKSKLFKLNFGLLFIQYVHA